MPKASVPARPGRATEGVIDAFLEGATEERVLRGLGAKGLLSRRVEPRTERRIDASGQEALLAKLRLRLKDFRTLPEGARQPLQVLVVLDQDDATLAAVVARVKGALDAALSASVELEPLPGQERVYRLRSPDPGLRLALCIAGNPAICDVFPDLSRRAMDDDVLLLALQPDTAAGMLGERHASRRVLGADRLLAKVKTEIPNLLSQNGLPAFVYAKDHIRFYAALLGISNSPATFAETVVRHAPVAELQRVFAPLLAALAEL